MNDALTRGRTAFVKITLQQPVIASSGVATAAAPTSLPYLPGAMLWGILASNAYRNGMMTRETREQILDSLYGGGVVIDDALPTVSGSLALPSPKSLYCPKSGGDWEDWSTDAGAYQHDFRQVKPDAMTCQMKEVRVTMVDTHRTAIDPGTLQAEDGRFYRLQAIAAHQSFVARISGPGEQVDNAVEVLQGEQYLGRSRNAEFGRVSIEKIESPVLPEPGPGEANYLWCLSDLAAHDKHYMPSERPDGGFFGVSVEIDWSRSFVRHRSYAPYNAAWKTRQPERLVITRGSVIVLKGNIEAGLHRFGFYQEQGLGLVLASAKPPKALLMAWQVESPATTQKQAKEESQDNQDEEKQDSPLAQWLEGQAKIAETLEQHRDDAEGAWETWKPRYEGAENLNGERCGPAPSQWSTLANMDDAKLEMMLQRFKESEGERERRSWQARFKNGDNGTFIDAAITLHREKGSASFRRHAHALRAALKQEWFHER